jgi:hypothetical protein
MVDEETNQFQLDTLKELEKKKKMIKEGTLAEFCRRIAEFKEEKNRLLEAAESHRKLQLKNGKDLYGYEVQRAHDLCQVLRCNYFTYRNRSNSFSIEQEEKEELQMVMLKKADQLLTQLQQEYFELTTTKRSKNNHQQPSSIQLGPAKKIRLESSPNTTTTTSTTSSTTSSALHVLDPKEIVLKNVEAFEDILLIAKERKETAKITKTTLKKTTIGILCTRIRTTVLLTNECIA